MCSWLYSETYCSYGESLGEHGPANIFGVVLSISLFKFSMVRKAGMNVASNFLDQIPLLA